MPCLPPSDKRQSKSGCISFLVIFPVVFFRVIGKHAITMGEISKAGAQVTKGVLISSLVTVK